MNETIGFDQRVAAGHDIDIRTINDLRSGCECLVQDFYFEGLNVMRCYEGRYRIERRGCPDICLEPGEVVIMYPGHTVTINALESSNRIVYGVFTGKDVAEYFNRLCCFDGLHGRCSSRYECVNKLRTLMKSELYGTVEGHASCLGYLSDLIVSIVNDIRTSGNTLVFDAIRQIRDNLSKGLVRLQDLCDELGVSRSYLHRIFREEGLGSISEFIKSEQLRRALWLLRNTDFSVSEVANATGFISATHFATFMKKRLGISPHSVRC